MIPVGIPQFYFSYSYTCPMKLEVYWITSQITYIIDDQWIENK